MASTQTFFDSMSRRFDENRTRHDKFQRSLEELKDMVRTLLVMEGLHSPSEEHQDRVDPAPSTQEPGSNLGANSEEQNCEMVYSSTKESIADLVGDFGHSRFEVGGDARRPKTMEDEEFEFFTQRVSAKKSHVATSPPSETHVARSFEVEEEPVHLKQVESSQRTLSPTLAPSSRDVLLNLEVDLGKEDQGVLSSSYGHEESESNSIPADIQESYTFLVRDVKTEIDPCNYCLIDSLVQDHILVVSNPEVGFNQSDRERIDAHGRKGNSLINPSQEESDRCYSSKIENKGSSTLTPYIFFSVLDFAFNEMDEMDGLIHDSSDCVEELDVVFADSVGLIRSVDSRVILNIPSAHKVFVEMPNREILLLVALLAGKFLIDKDVKLLAFLWPFDRGKLQYILGTANGFIFNVEGELILDFMIAALYVLELSWEVVLKGRYVRKGRYAANKCTAAIASMQKNGCSAC